MRWVLPPSARRQTGHRSSCMPSTRRDTAAGARRGCPWFSQAFAKGGSSLKAVQTLAPAGTGHAWAYVPDLAETFARLVDRGTAIPAFSLVHFAGHYDATGRELADAVRRATGRPDLP